MHLECWVPQGNDTVKIQLHFAFDEPLPHNLLGSPRGYLNCVAEFHHVDDALPFADLSKSLICSLLDVYPRLPALEQRRCHQNCIGNSNLDGVVLRFVSLVRANLGLVGSLLSGLFQRLLDYITVAYLAHSFCQKSSSAICSPIQTLLGCMIPLVPTLLLSMMHKFQRRCSPKVYHRL